VLHSNFIRAVTETETEQWQKRNKNRAATETEQWQKRNNNRPETEQQQQQQYISAATATC